MQNYAEIYYIPLHTDEPTAMDAVLTRIEEPLMSLSFDAKEVIITQTHQKLCKRF